LSFYFTFFLSCGKQIIYFLVLGKYYLKRLIQNGKNILRTKVKIKYFEETKQNNKRQNKKYKNQK